MAFVYSCCFYFSLRLGGIIIAIFSIIQAVVNIAVLCLAAENIDKIKQFLVPWIDDVSLTYVTDLISYFLEDKVTDLDKYIGYVITTLSFYILGCVFYIYGAYKLINILMFPFILLELLRLFVLTFFMITGLLVLKQNTMDLGLLIGISVIVGFTLVGMLYLWVCLANLPILINEMKEDEQIALIEKLQKIIEKRNLRYSSDWTDQPVGGGRFKLQNQKEIFFVSRNKIVDRPPQYNFKFNTAK